MKIAHNGRAPDTESFKMASNRARKSSGHRRHALLALCVACLLPFPLAWAGLPTNGMVLYYSFDSSHGAQVLDESGGGNHGAVSNATWSSFGISRGAFNFSGTNQYIDSGNMANWTNFASGFSFSFWIRDLETGAHPRYIAGTESVGLSNRFDLACHVSTWGDIMFRLYDSNGKEHRRHFEPGNRVDGQWHHMALQVGINGSEIRAYLDSQELAIVDSTGDAINLSGGLSFPLLVGAGADVSGQLLDTNTFLGYLDDFRIYDRLLTTNEIEVLYLMMRGEPDDTPAQAHIVWPGSTQSHTMKSLDDEDWVSFHTFTHFTNYTFSTKNIGTNVDTRLDIYRAREDGLLDYVAGVNNTGMGIDLGETWSLTDPSNDLYFVKISTPTGLYGPAVRSLRGASQSGDGRAFGESSEYSSELMASPESATINDIWVVAVAYPNRAAASWAKVGQKTQTFDGATALLFAEVGAGWHTVEVGSLNGVRPYEHPTRPNQIQNAWSDYGNPRQIYVDGMPEWPLFYYEPVNVQQATVRDAHTGAHLSNIAISCISTSAPFTNTEVRAGHAWETTYQQPWRTDRNGEFPTNLLLYPTQWSLRLEHEDYNPRTFTNAVRAMTWGAITNHGDLFIEPIDANGNGIADAWERHYFPGAMPIDPLADPDGDGANNRAEYLAGTDPTLASDRLSVTFSMGYQGFSLWWTGQPWRTYRIEIQASPEEEGWNTHTEEVIHWSPTSGQQNWSDWQYGAYSQRVYRLQVIPPGG